MFTLEISNQIAESGVFNPMLGSISLLSGVLLRSANTTDARHLPHMTDSPTRQTHLLLCLCISCSKVGTGKKKKTSSGVCVFGHSSPTVKQCVVYREKRGGKCQQRSSRTLALSRGGRVTCPRFLHINTGGRQNTRPIRLAHASDSSPTVRMHTHTSHRLHTHTHS